MNTKLILKTTNIYATLILVIDEHRETTSVTCSFLRTCKYEVDIRVTIGDKALTSIETPAVFLLIVCSFEHH